VNLAVLRWSSRRPAEAAVFARQALGLWDRLAEESPREPHYRRWLAKTCGILCSVGPDAAEGERLGLRAVELHRALAAEFPGVPTHRYELALSWHWLGRHRVGAGRDAEAVAAYGEALQRFDALAAEFPDRPDYFLSAGDTLANLSQMARDRGDLPEFHRLWPEAKKRWNAALAIDPTADRYRDKIRRDFSSAAEPPGRRPGDVESP
jgi:tetratricopeptide (TPR) repeat protein